MSPFFRPCMTDQTYRWKKGRRNEVRRGEKRKRTGEVGGKGGGKERPAY